MLHKHEKLTITHFCSIFVVAIFSKTNGDSVGANSIRVFKHLSDVTESIQRRDCSRFLCNV